MIKAILFDVYGTLISTGSGSIKACKKKLNEVGSEQNPEEFYSKWKTLHKKNMTCTSGFLTEKTIFTEDLKEL